VARLRCGRATTYVDWGTGRFVSGLENYGRIGWRSRKSWDVGGCRDPKECQA
jgi:hypothetical protein